MLISEAEFGSIVSRYKNVLYLCHRNADPDAIGSAFALAGAFGEFGFDPEADGRW